MHVVAPSPSPGCRSRQRSASSRSVGSGVIVVLRAEHGELLALPCAKPPLDADQAADPGVTLIALRALRDQRDRAGPASTRVALSGQRHLGPAGRRARLPRARPSQALECPERRAQRPVSPFGPCGPAGPAAPAGPVALSAGGTGQLRCHPSRPAPFGPAGRCTLGPMRPGDQRAVSPGGPRPGHAVRPGSLRWLQRPWLRGALSAGRRRSRPWHPRYPRCPGRPERPADLGSPSRRAGPWGSP